MTLDPVDSIDTLLDLKEERHTFPLITSTGETLTIHTIERRGPGLLGYDGISKIATQRDAKPDSLKHLKYTAHETSVLLTRAALAISDELDREVPRLLKKFDREKERYELGNCPFCPDNIGLKTPQPRMTYQGLYTDSGRPVISVPNAFPTCEDDWITVFADHKTDLMELSYNDVENIFLSGYQMNIAFRDRGAVSNHMYLNFREDAGGSNLHPHTHNEAVRDMDSFYRSSKRAKAIQGLNGNVDDLMEKLMENFRKKNLVIFEDDDMIVYAVWAPRYPNHVEAMLKKAGSLLHLSPSELRKRSRSLLGIFHGIRIIGGTSLNLGLHQSSFDGEPSGFRAQVEIFQRSGHRYGGLEATQMGYAITTLPEDLAHRLLEHYHR